jgi:hypothetical protein
MAVLSLQPRTVDEAYSGSSKKKEISFATPYNPSEPDTKIFCNWISEAASASRDWRAESWRDCEFYDGFQWDSVERQKAIDAGVEPLTINQIFPTSRWSSAPRPSINSTS